MQEELLPLKQGILPFDITRSSLPSETDSDAEIELLDAESAAIPLTSVEKRRIILEENDAFYSDFITCPSSNFDDVASKIRSFEGKRLHSKLGRAMQVIMAAIQYPRQLKADYATLDRAHYTTRSKTITVGPWMPFFLIRTALGNTLGIHIITQSEEGSACIKYSNFLLRAKQNIEGTFVLVTEGDTFLSIASEIQFDIDCIKSYPQGKSCDSHILDLPKAMAFIRDFLISR